MSAQVIKLTFPFDLLPTSVNVREQFSTLSTYFNCAQDGTPTGTLPNEHNDKRRRPGRRLSQNAWALHRPGKRARHRLRTLVQVT